MASRATQQAPQTATKSSFSQQRDELVGDIAVALENVLQNMNKFNRSLEGVIAVGNEFGAVEALWSQFEGVMAHGSEEKNGKDGAANEEEDDETGEEEYGEEVESASEKR